MPADVDRLIMPVLCHRIAFTAMFHADARRTGWDAAIDELPRRQSSSGRRARRCPTARSAPARCERGRGVVPARPAPPPRRARIRCDAELPPRAGVGRRRLAAVPRAATRCAGSTGPRRPASRPRAARTPSSSASASPTSRRASSSSPTGGPRWRSARPGSPGSSKADDDANRGAADRGEHRALPGRDRLARLRRRRRRAVWLSPRPSGLVASSRSAPSDGPFAGAGGRARALARVPRHRCAARCRRAASSSSSPTSSPTPDEAAWLEALGHRWDIVPVVIQDPVWEASFPEVGGVVVTFVDAATAACVRRVRHAPRRGSAAPRRARGAACRADPAVHRSRARAGRAHELRSGGDPGRVPRLGRCAADRQAGRPVRKLVRRRGADRGRAAPADARRRGGFGVVPRIGHSAHAPVRRPGRRRGAGGRAERRRRPHADQDRFCSLRRRRPCRGRAGLGGRQDRGHLALASRLPHARLPPGRDAAARRLRPGADQRSRRRPGRPRSRPRPGRS